jgi:sulfur carrier protein ThiS
MPEIEGLHEALSEGRTIAELLEEHGITLEDIITALSGPRAKCSQQAESDSGVIQKQSDDKGGRQKL